MANNCYNLIQIHGKEEEIKHFFSLLNDWKIKDDLSPCEIYTNLIQTFGDFGNDANWFEIDFDFNPEETKEVVIISGDSAWVPSLELFTAISKKYTSFKIRYEYEEMGCDFSGWADISEGNCTDNEFTYWKGIFEMQGEEQTKTFVIDNELECYETEAELIEADFYNLFTPENQKEILEAYNGKEL